jgi:type II secretory ATPase GspE/PulE/Tfp pilus assembly ATPase PilB-like protein
MNIKSIDDLVSILTKNEFDFLVVEPLENYVRISFKKDSILKLQKYIRYSNYSSLLINIKKLSSLDLEKTDIEQK